MILHNVFCFRDEAHADDCCLTNKVGSVTEDSELLFEFGVRKTAADTLKTSKPGATFPFQVQILYTKPNGMQCLRVQTAYREATTKQEKAEESMNVAMCSAMAAQQSARQAQEGDYESARVTSHAWRNYMAKVVGEDEAEDDRQEHFHKFCSTMTELDVNLQQAQLSEGRGSAAMKVSAQVKQPLTAFTRRPSQLEVLVAPTHRPRVSSSSRKPPRKLSSKATLCTILPSQTSEYHLNM